MVEKSQAAIKVNNLSKTYKIFNDPKDRLKETLNPFGKVYHRRFQALESLSFTINKGSAVGIIGKNGSGKSTLLKIITGVLSPTSGDVQVNGKISALLELGAGFNPELSGIENVYLYGTIMGFSKEEMDAKINEILSFADIGDFINQPVKTYSSGMFVRLAFAAAINVEPDILIVDEALSVGDMRFQQKCLRKIEELKEKKTILFVSHDLGAINKFCDRVIWIDSGNIVVDSTPLEVSKKYRAFMVGSQLKKYQEVETNQSIGDQRLYSDIDPIDPNLDVFGDNCAKIIGMDVYDSQNNKVSIMNTGETVKVVLKVQYFSEIVDPIIGFSIKDRLGNIVAQTNSFVIDGSIEPVKSDKTYLYTFEFVIPNVRNGEYSFSPAVASGTQEEHTQHCWIHDAKVYQIINDQMYDLEGFMYLEQVQFKTLQ